MGCTNRPPGASWAASGGGTRGCAAATTIASERRGVRQALASVAEHDGRVPDSLLREVRRGDRRELRDPLDAPHLTRQPREQGGLIAETRAHLQNALLATQAERFEHHGDQRGLARELPTTDPDRAVTLGLTGPPRWHVCRPPHLRSRLEHARIPHAGEVGGRGEAGRANRTNDAYVPPLPAAQAGIPRRRPGDRSEVGLR